VLIGEWGGGWWWVKDCLELIKIILHCLGQKGQTLKHDDCGIRNNLQSAWTKSDVGWKVAKQYAPEICWQSNSQWFRRGGRVGFADSISKRLVKIRRGNHGVQEAEQGTAFDEVGSADRMHLSDGLHERLGGDPADAEEFFHVHAAPGFGTGVRGALPDGVQIAGPFDGTTQAKTSAFRHFQDTGIIGTPAKNSPVRLQETTHNYPRQCELSC